MIACGAGPMTVRAGASRGALRNSIAEASAWRWIFIAVAALCAALTGIPSVSAQGTTPTQEGLRGPALVAALRGGGYILYFRHATTDFGQNDERMTGYEECATQRNLTDRGRTEAQALGAVLNALAIPIGDVLASPFCRTMETAQLIFGRATSSPAVRGEPSQTDSPWRYAALRELLSTPVRGATNLAIVGHGNPYRAVVGGPYLAEGEAAVIEPRSNDGFRVVARLHIEDWRPLEAARK
jgi:phosphohistidine phosphatase SixA